MKQVEIRELANTFGCAGGDTDHFGFRNLGLSQRTELYLEMASGYAVERLLRVGIGAVTDTRPGAYGGHVRTIRVNVKELDAICDAYFDRINGVPGVTNCYYCGMAMTGRGAFGEPVCQECGG